jgi:alginate O-acetyltransferase complex protein AlgJ
MGAGEPDARSITGAGHTREEQALAELGHTSFSRGVAWTLTVTFLVTLAIVPIIQAWSALYNVREHALAPSPGANSAVVHAGWPSASGILDTVRRLIALVPSDDGIRRFERDFERRSVVGGVIRSKAQGVITSRFGVGNDTVYVGRDRWLFYRTGYDYVTGPGFLSPHFLAARRSAVQQPDPRPAILRLHEQLARRGITLVLFPTPDKLMIYPDRFHGSRARWATMPQNPSYDLFKKELELEGVRVFDPAADLYSKRAGQQLFQRGDTHWMPETVELVARGLADAIGDPARLPGERSNYRVQQVDVVLPQFDLVNLLQLPPGQALIEPITVRVRQVSGPTGDLWTPTRSAGVLVLGDSFCMMFEKDQADRPLAAGLPQQLSYELDRPLDRICVPGGGSYLARQLLINDLVNGKRRLADVRVVIWQFAIRELIAGDWRVIDLPES